MNRTLLLIGLLTSSFLAHAAPCVQASLQDYAALGGGGCTVGNATFSGFDIVLGPNFSMSIDASLVQVLPTGSIDQPALQFSLAQNANSNEFFDLFFRFTVLADRLTGSSIRLDGASADGEGVALGVVDICPGGSFAMDSPQGCITQPDSLVAIQIDGFGDLVDTRALMPVGFFDVFVDLSVDGGPSGSASLQSATVGFTAVPEPGTAVLVLSAVVFAVSSRHVRKMFQNKGSNV